MVRPKPISGSKEYHRVVPFASTWERVEGRLFGHKGTDTNVRERLLQGDGREQTTTTGSDAPYSRRRAVLALAALSFAVFEAALDQTFVLTVMPSIMASLRIPYTRLDDAGWIVTGYLLGYTVAMPLFGRLADVRGRRLMYAVALVIVSLGSALCVVAPRLDLFIASRVIMAAGGGALIPIAMAAGADLFPVRRRALVLGVVEASAQGGAVLGPIYGVALAQLWNWRLIFLVNIPICLFLAVFSTRLLPARARFVEGEDEPAEAPALPRGARSSGAGGPEERTASGRGREAWARLRSREVDYLGAILFALVLAGLTIGLSGSGELDENPVNWAWLAVGGAALLAFVLHERRTQQPLIRFDFFRHPPFTAANVASLLVGGALIIALVEVPLYAYSLLGLTEIEGGLLLIRLTLMIPVGAVLGGWLADLVGYRPTAVLGFAIACIGFILISLWPPEPGGVLLTRDLMITGFGFGLVIPPIGATVIASVGPRWMATGAALVTVTRTIGMIFGLATLSSWGVRRFNQMTADLLLPLRTPDMTDAEYQALLDAYTGVIEASLRTIYRDFFVMAAIIIGVAVLPALFFRLRRREGPARFS